MELWLMVAGSLFGGYLCGAFGGMGLTRLLSGRRHDSSLEAGVTGLLVTGPLVAAVFLAAVMSWYTRTQALTL